MKVIKDKSSITPNSDPDGHRQQYPYSYSMHTGADRGRPGYQMLASASGFNHDHPYSEQPRLDGRPKQKKQIGRHARPRQPRPSATAPLRTGADASRLVNAKAEGRWRVLTAQDTPNRNSGTMPVL